MKASVRARASARQEIRIFSITAALAPQTVPSHIPNEDITIAQTASARMTGSGSASTSASALVSEHEAQQPQTFRRRLSVASMAAVIAASLLPASQAQAFSCPGLSGRALQVCLREERQKREAVEAESGAAAAQDARYEQPGMLVTLASGQQYREIETGTGSVPAELGSICEITYVVYRLSSGAYFKYSSGGTPVFLFSLGYGQEGKRDVGETYRFRLGDRGALPAAATPAVVGMVQGSKRRVLIPPRMGWVDDTVGPRPETFGGQRRLVSRRDEALLFEIELVRVYPPSGSSTAAEAGGSSAGVSTPWRFPAPPSPFQNKLG